MKNKIYAVVEKNSKRVIAVIDGSLKSFFENQFTVFDVIEVFSVGSSTLQIKDENGIFTISTISISPKGNFYMKDDYHLIKDYPDDKTLEETYKIINNRK